MPRSNLGSGPALDENWDLSVGPDGDIRTVSGVDELEKDLAYILTRDVRPLLGGTGSANYEAQILDKAARSALTLGRVIAVDRDNSKADWDPVSEQLELSLVVQTNTNRVYDFIVEIEQ